VGRDTAHILSNIFSPGKKHHIHTTYDTATHWVSINLQGYSWAFTSNHMIVNYSPVNAMAWLWIQIRPWLFCLVWSVNWSWNPQTRPKILWFWFQYHILTTSWPSHIYKCPTITTCLLQSTKTKLMGYIPTHSTLSLAVFRTVEICRGNCSSPSYMLSLRILNQTHWLDIPW
jgi:hypothetical protein